MSENAPGSKWAAVLRVTSGNFLEMFDFFLFGFYATYISQTFFPAESEYASLMFTFMTFAAGFLMRPLGAIVLGAYLDRAGRRKGLIVTLAIMAMGTVLIAFVPGYRTLGALAPLLVLSGRLLQGFSAGVEPGGVSVYLSEMATPGHKGFYTSWQSASQQIATVVAALLGYALNRYLPQESLRAWGWRVPFFIGSLIVPFIFLIRRSLQETPEFMAREHTPTASELLQSLLKNRGIVLFGMLMVIMSTVSFYLITVYTPTFGQRELKLTASDALTVTVCVGLSNFFWLPLAGAASDRIGRWPLLIGIAALTVATAYPTLSWLTARPSFLRMLLCELWLSVLYSGYNGTLIVALTELVPAHVRTVGFSLAYSLATTLGGSSPAIATWLIERTHDKAAPALWMTFAACCGLAGTLFLYRRDVIARARSLLTVSRRGP
jgi:MHS family citrate/tricarballylate:H+ symporter-like MFS transporter